MVLSSNEVIEDESFVPVSSSLIWATIGNDFELHSIFLHDLKESNVVHPYIYHLLEKNELNFEDFYLSGLKALDFIAKKILKIIDDNHSHTSGDIDKDLKKIFSDNLYSHASKHIT
jgi:hypothetical protein